MELGITASADGYVFPGHFAHADKFYIYEYDGRGVRLVEVRENPLSRASDLDTEGHAHVGPRAHGVAKYSWLRENALPDVEVIIATAACQTSVDYFTSEGVRVLFTDPAPINMLEKYMGENAEELNRVLGYAD
ncbi:NifB/NifX family molybdenum-iron cluster-binding protein [Thermoproteus tenax]|uniref:NifX family iron-molybdenum cluster-binding protein n=1 Tax=Thermoproteus tenax (strain ATCC 35583 / DSM 2078 / JCM 9277 / NBRC 100435 / Kra 1) TaxID=768679 RepID=G4RK65_THETK|nr:NifB/NifX family molybdenum-iron cluster-binding protein [Thermoproteus tenax]CCC81960.1 NifX family iron-molybdenum cluster-binding protein [Thermoproteus tenax Kra 1]